MKIPAIVALLIFSALIYAYYVVLTRKSSKKQPIGGTDDPCYTDCYTHYSCIYGCNESEEPGLCDEGCSGSGSIWDECCASNEGTPSCTNPPTSDCAQYSP